MQATATLFARVSEASRRYLGQEQNWLTVQLIQAGSNVILAARRLEALKAVAEQCAVAHKEGGSQLGGKFAVVQVDVADKKQVASLFDQVPEDLRQVDVLGVPNSLHGDRNHTDPFTRCS